MGLNKVEYENAVNLTRKIKEKFSDEQIRELSVLNLGAGTCGSFVSIHLRSLPVEQLDNVEIFRPSFEVLEGIKFAAKRVGNYNMELRDYLRFTYDGRAIDTISVLASYHITVMIDVIEHLPKEDGWHIINLIKYIKRKNENPDYPNLLLFVPIGDCPQEEYAGNSYQKHLSTWELDDFKDFEVEYHPELHGSFGAAWVWI